MSPSAIRWSLFVLQVRLRSLSKLRNFAEMPEMELSPTQVSVINHHLSYVLDTIPLYAHLSTDTKRTSHPLTLAREFCACGLPIDSDEWVHHLRQTNKQLNLDAVAILLVRSALTLAILLEIGSLLSSRVLTTSASERVYALIRLLPQSLSNIPDDDLFAQLYKPEVYLLQDPSWCFIGSDSETKLFTRLRLDEFAVTLAKERTRIAHEALDLARGALENPLAQRDLETNLMFYLIDQGRGELLSRLTRAVAVRPSRWPNPHIEIPKYRAVWLFIALALSSYTTIYLATSDVNLLATLVISLSVTVLAMEAANRLTDSLAGLVLTPRILPKLERAEMLTDSVIVAVPTLLDSEAQFDSLCRRLHPFKAKETIRCRAIVLLTDFPDSGAPGTSLDEQARLAACKMIVQRLNAEAASTYPECPQLLMLHRDRTYSYREKRWMGADRKRGKLRELNLLLTGDQGSLWDSDPEALKLRGATHVLVLDDTSSLDPASLDSLVRAAHHPFNVPRIAKAKARGYAVIQPSPVVSSASLLAWDWMKAWLEVGCESETESGIRRSLDFELFGVSGFYGKGLYDVRAFKERTDHLPVGVLLSHDIPEGGFAATAFDGASRVVDEAPVSLKTHYQRLSRWCRGDWLNLVFYFQCLQLRLCQQGKRKLVGTLNQPLGVVGRGHMYDDLGVTHARYLTGRFCRRSLTPIFQTLLLLVYARLWHEQQRASLRLIYFAIACGPELTMLVLRMRQGITSGHWALFSKGTSDVFDRVIAEGVALCLAPQVALIVCMSIAASLWSTVTGGSRLTWTSSAIQEGQRTRFAPCDLVVIIIGLVSIRASALAYSAHRLLSEGMPFICWIAGCCLYVKHTYVKARAQTS